MINPNRKHPNIKFPIPNSKSPIPHYLITLLPYYLNTSLPYYLTFHHTLHHLLHPFKSSGTMMHVLFMNMNVLGDLSFIEMGKLRTVGRTHFIDGTKIGFAIEELAGSTHIHPLAFAVFIQPFFFELTDGHVQEFGN